ncbi:MAG: hypothetical protein ACKO03_10245, partial [Bacteroidota bacterium]
MKKYCFILIALLMLGAGAYAQNGAQPVANVSDISIVKTVDKSIARVGTEVVFTLELRNLGPYATQRVVVEDILPNGFTFISASSLNYDIIEGKWKEKDIAAGANRILTIRARVNPITPASVYRNDATIIKNENNDPVANNNSSFATVFVYDFDATDAVICSGSTATLQASSVNVVNPIFRWYADPQLTNLLFTGPSLTTPPLSNTAAYYLTVSGTNLPAPTPADAVIGNALVLSTPSDPIVQVTQPTCAVSTGVISISSPKGVGLSYSIDGLTYTNTTGVFSGVLPGTYSVTVRNSNGCVSAQRTVTVDAQPVTPVAPSLSVTQPTCAV